MPNTWVPSRKYRIVPSSVTDQPTGAATEKPLGSWYICQPAGSSGEAGADGGWLAAAVPVGVAVGEPVAAPPADATPDGGGAVALCLERPDIAWATSTATRITTSTPAMRTQRYPARPARSFPGAGCGSGTCARGRGSIAVAAGGAGRGGAAGSIGSAAADSPDAADSPGPRAPAGSPEAADSVETGDSAGADGDSAGAGADSAGVAEDS